MLTYYEREQRAADRGAAGLVHDELLLLGARLRRARHRARRRCDVVTSSAIAVEAAFVDWLANEGKLRGLLDEYRQHADRVRAAARAERRRARKEATDASNGR